MNKKTPIMAIAALSFFVTSFAAAEENRHKYFEVIQTENTLNIDEPIKVLYFFNINCPSCKKVSPLVDEWREKIGDMVMLEEIPYAPYDDWEWASKAYLTAKEMSPEITRKSVEDAQNQTGIEAATDILRAADIVSYATSSSRGKIMTMLSSKDMNDVVQEKHIIAEKYGVYGVPSIVVVGHQEAYRVSPEFGLTKEGMINVTEALVTYQHSKKEP